MRKWLFALFILSLGITEAKEQLILADYQISLIEPINSAVSPPYSLMIIIPKDYQLLQADSDLLTSPFLEFVPKGQNGENWTEIITAQRIVGHKIVAKDLIDEVKKEILKIAKAKVLKNKNDSQDGYSTSNLIVAYDLQGKHEVLGMRYYSGPYDCSGIQYTIRPQKGESDETIRKKIETFFDAQTEVIKQEIPE